MFKPASEVPIEKHSAFPVVINHEEGNPEVILGLTKLEVGAFEIAGHVYASYPGFKAKEVAMVSVDIAREILKLTNKE